MPTKRDIKPANFLQRRARLNVNYYPYMFYKIA